tara:strand:- start:209 stop:475 length:267 start_codon:yes stop_codon:yes gene_type:complete
MKNILSLQLLAQRSKVVKNQRNGKKFAKNFYFFILKSNLYIHPHHILTPPPPPPRPLHLNKKHGWQKSEATEVTPKNQSGFLARRLES